MGWTFGFLEITEPSWDDAHGMSRGHERNNISFL